MKGRLTISLLFPFRLGRQESLISVCLSFSDCVSFPLNRAMWFCLWDLPANNERVFTAPASERQGSKGRLSLLAEPVVRGGRGKPTFAPE